MFSDSYSQSTSLNLTSTQFRYDINIYENASDINLYRYFLDYVYTEYL